MWHYITAEFYWVWHILSAEENNENNIYFMLNNLQIWIIGDDLVPNTISPADISWFQPSKFLKLIVWYTIPSQIHAQTYLHPNCPQNVFFSSLFFKAKTSFKLHKMFSKQIESSSIQSLILAAWRHGKLCGNPCLYVE